MISTDFSAVCHEFTDALTEVLAENAVGLARRGRLARARAAVKKHPDYSEHAYFLAVETAFKNWKPCRTSVASTCPPTRSRPTAVDKATIPRPRSLALRWRIALGDRVRCSKAYLRLLLRRGQVASALSRRMVGGAISGSLAAECDDAGSAQNPPLHV